MRRKVFILLIILVGIGITVFAAQQQQNLKQKAAEREEEDLPAQKVTKLLKYVPGEIIVKFKKDETLSNVLKEKSQQSSPFDEISQSAVPSVLQTINNKYNIETINKVFPEKDTTKAQQYISQTPNDETQRLSMEFSRIYKLTLDKNASLENVIEDLSNDSSVAYAEPNYIATLEIVPNDPYYLDSYPDNISNRDSKWNPPYDYQWDMKKIMLGQALDITLGSNPVIVAVIDTGVDCAHRELMNRCVDGYDFIDRDNTPTDSDGHGTHVAGTIGAFGNNNLGITGIDWQTKIMPVRSFGPEGGTIEDIAAGIKFAADNGAQITNMSFGTRFPGSTPFTVDQALNYADALGVVQIGAAGNSYSDVSLGYWPANHEKVIAVAATNYLDKKPAFSNYGSKVKISAPGVNIISLRAKDTDMYLGSPGYVPGSLIIGNDYYLSSGTSMAAPHVAGMAAILKSKYPMWSSVKIAQVIAASGDSIDAINPEFIGKVGNRANLFNALDKEVSGVIVSPQGDSSILKSGSLEISGSAIIVNSDSIEYDISYSVGDNPSSWIDTGISYPPEGRFREVINGRLATLDTSTLTDSSYTLKLTVKKPGSSKNTVVLRKFRVVSGELVGWPKRFTPATIRSDTYCKTFIEDLDNDGSNEVVFCSPGVNKLTVWKQDQQSPLWEKTFSFYSPNGIAIDDLDNDGKKEIIVSVYTNPSGPNEAKLFVYTHTGEVMWSVEHNLLGTLTTANDNGRKIIVMRGQDIRGGNVTLRGYFSNGTLYWNKDLGATSSRTNTAISDLDGDGSDEIITGDRIGSSGNTGGIKVFKADGRGFLRSDGFFADLTFPDFMQNTGADSITVGDLEGDGSREIIVMGSVDLFVFNNEGKLKWSKRLYNTGEISLADLDSDGKLEIIVTGGKKVFLYKYDGTVIPGKNAFNEADYYAFFNPSSLLVSPTTIIGAVGKKNEPNITVVSDKIYAWENIQLQSGSRPNYLEHFPIIIQGALPSGTAALIKDIDRNGTTDLLFATDDGYVHALDLKIPFNPQQNPWPEYLHDGRNTASYADLSSPPTKTPTPLPLPTVNIVSPIENTQVASPISLEVSVSNTSLLSKLDVWIDKSKTIEKHFVFQKNDMFKKSVVMENDSEWHSIDAEATLTDTRTVKAKQIFFLVKQSSFACEIYGDLNLDGRVTALDADIVSKIVSGQQPTGNSSQTGDNQYMKTVGDVTGDQNITSEDALRIRKYADGSESTFPVCQEAKLPPVGCNNLGDVTTDGKVTTMDAYEALRMNLRYPDSIYTKQPYTDEQKRRANVNLENNSLGEPVDSLDSLLILRYFKGMDATLRGCNSVTPQASSPKTGLCNACSADSNKDGQVSLVDYSLMVSCYDQQAAGRCAGFDTNQSGKVDIEDAACIINQFGNKCGQ